MKLIPLGLLLLLGFVAHAQNPAAPQTAMQLWLSTLDTTWQETFARDVTAPFDAEMAKLAKQYAAALDSNVAKATKDGNLDATLLWRTERDRFAVAKNVPPQDEPNAPVAFKQLRADWRTQAARLEKERADRAKTVYANYDQVLAQAQKQLTQAARIEEAMQVKAKREEVAKRSVPVAAILAVAEELKPPAPVAPATPAPPGATPRAGAPSAKSPKLPPAELVAKLLAAGVDTSISEPGGKRQRLTSAENLPAKFTIYELQFRARKDGVPVTDADVALIQDLDTLDFLALRQVAVTDASLAMLRSLSKLRMLKLDKLDQLTAAGCSLLADAPALTDVGLNALPAGEAAIIAVARNKRVTGLELVDMPLTDAAMAAIGDSNVVTLSLQGEMTAAQLAHVARMKKLGTFWAGMTTIDDAGAAELAKATGLKALMMGRAQVTEAGLASLSKLTNLTDLRLTAPPITPGVIASFKKMRALRSLNVGPHPAEEGDTLRAALKGVGVKST
jgi:hypothetical protein